MGDQGDEVEPDSGKVVDKRAPLLGTVDVVASQAILLKEDTIYNPERVGESPTAGVVEDSSVPLLKEVGLTHQGVGLSVISTSSSAVASSSWAEQYCEEMDAVTARCLLSVSSVLPIFSRVFIVFLGFGLINSIFVSFQGLLETSQSEGGSLQVAGSSIEHVTVDKIPESRSSVLLDQNLVDASSKAEGVIEVSL